MIDCPTCGQPQLKKLMSAAGFRLKGSGWYETDFKKGNQKNVAKDEAPSKDSAIHERLRRYGRLRRLSGGSLVASGVGLTFGAQPCDDSDLFESRSHEPGNPMGIVHV